MKILDGIIQGTPEWDAIRAKHKTASEASAMMGASPHVSRNDLIKMKAISTEKEFSEWVKKNILQKGHDIEAMARPIAEAIIGDALYPITATDDTGTYLASYDGLTIEETAWECKQWNEQKATIVRDGGIPDEDFWQCVQHLLIGADKVLYMVTDGTIERTVSTWLHREHAPLERLIAGWAQFDEDVANYQHVEVIPKAVPSSQMSLPTVSIEVSGNIALIDNLSAFGDALNIYIERINKEPKTDQDFADLEAVVKTLQNAENALKTEEQRALAQTASIDEMRKAVEKYHGIARTHRLFVEKLVKAEKENRRAAIVQGAKDKLAEQINKLNARLGMPYMPTIQADFAGVIKGLKTLSSIQNAVDTELARATIEAKEVAIKLEKNLMSLKELASDYKFLFSDTRQIIEKENDDLVALIKMRIADHKAAEEAKLEAERERIRKEEEAKALRLAEAERERIREGERERIRQEEAAKVKAEDKQEAIAKVEPPSEQIKAASLYGLPMRKKRPTDAEIIKTVSEKFGVTENTAIDWLKSMDFSSAA